MAAKIEIHRIALDHVKVVFRPDAEVDFELEAYGFEKKPTLSEAHLLKGDSVTITLGGDDAIPKKSE